MYLAAVNDDRQPQYSRYIKICTNTYIYTAMEWHIKNIYQPNRNIDDVYVRTWSL